MKVFVLAGTLTSAIESFRYSHQPNPDNMVRVVYVGRYPETSLLGHRVAPGDGVHFADDTSLKTLNTFFYHASIYGTRLSDLEIIL